MLLLPVFISLLNMHRTEYFGLVYSVFFEVDADFILEYDEKFIECSVLIGKDGYRLGFTVYRFGLIGMQCNHVFDYVERFGIENEDGKSPAVICCNGNALSKRQVEYLKKNGVAVWSCDGDISSQIHKTTLIDAKRSRLTLSEVFLILSTADGDYQSFKENSRKWPLKIQETIFYMGRSKFLSVFAKEIENSPDSEAFFDFIRESGAITINLEKSFFPFIFSSRMCGYRS